MWVPLRTLARTLLVTVALTASTSAATAPIAFYPAENDASDIGPSHHNGTVPATAATHFSVGKVGVGFHFDGADYIDLGDWFASQSATIGFWINDAGAQADGAPVILSKSALGIAWSVKYRAVGQNYQYSSDDGATINFSLTPGKWQYVAITRASSSRRTKIYVDGVVAGEATGTSDINYDFGPAIRLGSESLTVFWKGDIDEVRFYDRDLSAEEIGLVSATGIDIVVPGTSNPYVADPASDGSGDGPASPSPNGIAVTGGQTISFVVAGSVSYAGTPVDPADGSTGVSHGEQAGISGSVYPANALLGVFLDDAPSTASAAPASTDFSDTGVGRNFTTLSPALKQIFFIGDGLTDASVVQKFTVPAGAKRLFLGTGDGSGWYNNMGSFSVHVLGGDAPSALSATSLTINANTIPGAITPGGPLHIEAVQTSNPAGLKVRAQFSTTPDVEGSWTDLPDGAGGNLRAAATAGHYAVDTTFYPAGPAVYFRAISSAPGLSDSVSNVIGPFDLKQAILKIHASASSDSDPGGHSARAGDKLTYTLTFSNEGNAPAKSLQVATLVPSYIDAMDSTNSQRQFTAADFESISPGGEIVNVADLAGTNTQWLLPGGDAVDPLDASGSPRKAIRWYVGDLAPGLQQFVAYTLKIGSSIRVPSTITSSNVYAVSSTIAQPPVAGDERTSNADIFSVDIRGPISILAGKDIGATTPGGVLSFSFTVTNLSGTLQQNTVAAITIPEHARFDSVYPDITKQGDRRSGVSVLSASNKVLTKSPRGFHFLGVNSVAGAPRQVVLSLGTLRPHASYNFRVSFQAQWVDPAEVPKIELSAYAAAFLNSKLSDVIPAILQSGTNQDFIDYLTNPNNTVAYSENDSGILTTGLSGSLNGEPRIGVIKSIVDNSKTQMDTPTSQDQGNGERLNTVAPGGQISFVVVARNDGANDANDVYIQDRVPEGCVLLTGGKNPQVIPSESDDLHSAITFALKTASTDASKDSYAVSLDADERTLRVTGLHLDPHDSVAIRYTVRVKTAGDDAPAIDSVIRAGTATIGTSSNTHTPVSVPGVIPVKVVATPSFTFEITPTSLQPLAADNPSAAADVLTAVYTKDFNAPPWKPGATADSAPQAYAGEQRYYIAYTNTSGTAVTDVDLKIPVPQNCLFYRASYVDPAKGTLVPAPAGVTITAPQSLSGGGVVTVHFNKMTKGESGRVMLEVVVTTAGVKPSGSKAVLEGVTMGAASSPFAASPGPRALGTRARATLVVTRIADSTHIPSICIGKVVPQTVHTGDVFDIQLFVGNRGEIAADPIIAFKVPVGAEILSYTYGNTTVPLSGFKTDDYLLVPVASDDAPITQGQLGRLRAHSAAAISVRLKATSLIESITDTESYVAVDYVGKMFFEPTATRPVSSSLLGLAAPVGANLTAITNADFLQLPNGAILVPLGGGAIVATGGGNIVAQGGGNIVAQGGGNIVASGAGNLVTLKNVATLGDTTGAGVLANLIGIVAQGGGNIFNTGAGNIIGNDGASLVNNSNTALRIGTVAQLVQARVASIVAQGGGNIVAQGAGNIIAQGGGNIVAQGGGNIVAQGGGNFGVIFTSGGGIVAQGGGNLAGSSGFKTTGGLFTGSLTGSSALLNTPSGIVAAGAGNITEIPTGN